MRGLPSRKIQPDWLMLGAALALSAAGVLVNASAGGEAALAIEVIGHRRNSHGPLHLAEKWPPWTGPAEFVAGPDRWFDGYQLVPCGLMAPPELVVRE